MDHLVTSMKSSGGTKRGREEAVAWWVAHSALGQMTRGFKSKCSSLCDFSPTIVNQEGSSNCSANSMGQIVDQPANSLLG